MVRRTRSRTQRLKSVSAKRVRSVRGAGGQKESARRSRRIAPLAPPTNEAAKRCASRRRRRAGREWEATPGRTLTLGSGGVRGVDGGVVGGGRDSDTGSRCTPGTQLGPHTVSTLPFKGLPHQYRSSLRTDCGGGSSRTTRAAL